MSEILSDDDALNELKAQLKALSNRFAVELLHVLSPLSGDIVPAMGWEDIVEGILSGRGISKPSAVIRDEKTREQAQYEELRRRLVSGGTLYESMSKLIQAGFVQAIGPRGKKQRQFMITHEGRLALSAVSAIHGPTVSDTEIQSTAKILLKHKNYTRLLPGQEKFMREIRKVDSNLIIQMPPGSGKTFLAMAIILSRLQKGVKCLYLSPYISLSRQVIDEYGELLEKLGYSVVRYDGSFRASEQKLEAANLVVGMYESVLSSLLQRRKWVEKIGFAVVDELTTLDSNIVNIQARTLGTDRSVKLDCLMTLLKQYAQLVTLSSRFGNTEQLAKWLDAEVFRPTVRLQPDEFVVSGKEGEFDIVSCDGAQNVHVKAGSPLNAIFTHVCDYQNKSVLVVAGLRDGAEYIANSLGERYPREIPSEVIDTILGPSEDMPVSSRLRQSLQKGYAFHHAGLSADLRERLERSIQRGEVTGVVSTTGITSGTSFPFDCVVILFETISFPVNRSRYLQIAGRIGEYYLAEHGGAVYLVFGQPTRQFPDPEALEKTLLHEPLEPLLPGPLYPSLSANLIMRAAVKRTQFEREEIESGFLKLVVQSFKGSNDTAYRRWMRKEFDTLFKWLTARGVFESFKQGYRVSKDARAAVLAGLNIIDFVKERATLASLDEDSDELELLRLLIDLSLPRSIRPSTILPLEIELKVAGLDNPKDWYLELIEGRERVKLQVLEDWLDEKSAIEVLNRADELAAEVRMGQSPAAGSDLDEGDLGSLMSVCSEVSWNLAEFMRSIKKRRLARRFETLSRQLRYGLHEDLANTDLPELWIEQSGLSPLRQLTRKEMRTLFENGYASIEDVVRKDIDPAKEGLARNRFAKNCGLDDNLAKQVYKSALVHVRMRLPADR